MKWKSLIVVFVITLILVGCNTESIYDSQLISDVTIDSVESTSKILTTSYFVLITKDEIKERYKLGTSLQYEELRNYIKYSEYNGVLVKSDIIVNSKTKKVKGIYLTESSKEEAHN